jgi:hypothetical protein
MTAAERPAPPPAEDEHLIVAHDEEVTIEHHPERIAFAVFWVLAFIVFLQFFSRYI